MEISSERLRDLRDSKHVKQKDVAAVLGTTQQIYSNYESGKSDLPLRHLVALADYYGVSTDYLLGRVSYAKMPSEYTRPFIQQVSVGDFICRITSFDSVHKRQLVDYVNYLTYLENNKK